MGIFFEFLTWIKDLITEFVGDRHDEGLDVTNVGQKKYNDNERRRTHSSVVMKSEGLLAVANLEVFHGKTCQTLDFRGQCRRVVSPGAVFFRRTFVKPMMSSS